MLFQGDGPGFLYLRCNVSILRLSMPSGLASYRGQGTRLFIGDATLRWPFYLRCFGLPLLRLSTLSSLASYCGLCRQRRITKILNGLHCRPGKLQPTHFLSNKSIVFIARRMLTRSPGLRGEGVIASAGESESAKLKVNLIRPPGHGIENFVKNLKS